MANTTTAKEFYENAQGDIAWVNKDTAIQLMESYHASQLQKINSSTQTLNTTFYEEIRPKMKSPHENY